MPFFTIAVSVKRPITFNESKNFNLHSYKNNTVEYYNNTITIKILPIMLIKF
nr:MAG TPA: hypothetical protein [Caudoviricetes sp.]